jgi:hypothetical protein
MSTNPLQYIVKKKPYFTNVLYTLDDKVLESEAYLQLDKRLFYIVDELMVSNWICIVNKLKTYEI